MTTTATTAPSESALPEVRGHWLFGKAREMAQAPHILPARLGWDHGGVARFRILRYPVLAITDPGAAREVLHGDTFERTYHYESYASVLGQSLMATDGPHWSRRRRMVLPAFKAGHLNRFTRVMRDCTFEMMDLWDTESADGKPMDAMQMAIRITMSVISMSLTSVPISVHDADRLAAHIDHGMLCMRLRNNSLVRLPFWVPISIHRDLRALKDELDSYLGPVVKARVSNPDNERKDLLDDLRAARAAGTGEAMNFTELLEETKTLFVTGYETTSLTMAWALYMLASFPEMAEPWHEEVSKVLPGDEVPDRLRLEDFPYTTAVVNETMRLYPAVYNLVRKARTDTTIRGCPVRRGEMALVSLYGLHRNPAFWDAPETFNPHRFLDTPGNDAFLPFGSGGHLCVGAHFSFLEMVTVLALIGRRFRLRTLASAVPEVVARVTLAPKEPLLMALEPRIAPRAAA